MLGQFAGEPLGRLVALWEQAEASARDAGSANCAVPSKESAGRATETCSSGASAARPAATGWIRLTVIVTVMVIAAAWTGVVVFRVLDTTPRAGTGTSRQVPLTVGCRGVRCEGLEASAMACDVDAASYADKQIGLSHVELRTSRNCASAWGRVSYSSVGDRVTVEDRAGRAETATVINRGSTDRYVATHMLAMSSGPLRVCWEPVEGGRQCTPWARP